MKMRVLYLNLCSKNERGYIVIYFINIKIIIKCNCVFKIVVVQMKFNGSYDLLCLNNKQISLLCIKEVGLFNGYLEFQLFGVLKQEKGCLSLGI